MAIGIDTSKWKPRQLRGTPAAKFRNLLCYAFLAFGISSGVFLQYTDFTKGLRKSAEVLYEDPIEEVERRMMIAGGLPVLNRDEMKELMAENERLDLPNK